MINKEYLTKVLRFAWQDGCSTYSVSTLRIDSRYFWVERSLRDTTRLIKDPGR